MFLSTKTGIRRCDPVENIVKSTETGEEFKVWGINLAFSDGTGITLMDLCSEYEDVLYVINRLAGSEFSRAHIYDLVEDFLGEVYSFTSPVKSMAR